MTGLSMQGKEAGSDICISTLASITIIETNSFPCKTNL